MGCHSCVQWVGRLWVGGGFFLSGDTEVVVYWKKGGDYVNGVTREGI